MSVRINSDAKYVNCDADKKLTSPMSPDVTAVGAEVEGFICHRLVHGSFPRRLIQR